MEERELKEIVAQNIFYLRTIHHMTQYELGEQINYSDKAISKWERAESIPDIYVLKNISDLFGVSIDYLLKEHSEQDKKIEKMPVKRGRWLIVNLVMLSVMTVALLLFVIIAIATEKYIWQIFIYALPVVSIVGIVFSATWRRIFGIFAFASMLLWTTLLTIYFAVGNYAMWMIFLVGIPVQIIVFLSFGIKVSIKMNQKDNPIIKIAMDNISKKHRNNTK